MAERDQSSQRTEIPPTPQQGQRGRFYADASRRQQTGPSRSEEGERMDYGRSPWWGGHERRPVRRRPLDRHRQHEVEPEAHDDLEAIGEPLAGTPPPRSEREGFEQRRFRDADRYDDERTTGERFPEDIRAGERGGRPHAERRRGWQRETLVAREIMTRDVKTVMPDSPLAEVAALMRSENCGIVPVVDGERRLLGVVTDRDIVVRTLAEGRSPETAVARDVMTDDVSGVTADDPVREIIELMGRSQVRRIPVVDRNDRLLGIISMADIANRADYDEDLQDALERISARRSFWARLWS